MFINIIILDSYRRRESCHKHSGDFETIYSLNTPRLCIEVRSILVCLPFNHHQYSWECLCQVDLRGGRSSEHRRLFRSWKHEPKSEVETVPRQSCCARFVSSLLRFTTSSVVLINNSSNEEVSMQVHVCNSSFTSASFFFRILISFAIRSFVFYLSSSSSICFDRQGYSCMLCMRLVILFE